MTCAVIDTNVLATANGEASHASPLCVKACIKALQVAKVRQATLVDSLGRIFSEYLSHASRSGQPGLGDAFVKWLWLNQGYSRRCRQVVITPRGLGKEDYQEFPSDQALATFDHSDRKFVAVALASGANPTILNATDTGWWQHRNALSSHGVKVRFLCPSLMATGSNHTRTKRAKKNH